MTNSLFSVVGSVPPYVPGVLASTVSSCPNSNSSSEIAAGGSVVESLDLWAVPIATFPLRMSLGCGISRCSGNTALGRHCVDPTTRYGMRLSTTSGTTVPQGVSQYGFFPAFQTKENPLCIHRLPTDESEGHCCIIQKSGLSWSSGRSHCTMDLHVVNAPAP